MTQPEQRSDSWHQQRIGRVTGSRVGAILHLNPWQTREDVLRAMVREYHGAPSEFSGNIATRFGTENEPMALMHYERITGTVTDKAYFVPYDEWLGASPDALVNDDGLVELKCPYSRRNDADFKPLSEQPHYAAQIQVQLFVTGREWCDFFQYSPKGHKIERIERDDDWLATNIPALRQFHAEYLSELDNPAHLEPLRKEINTQHTALLLEEYDSLKDAIALAQERQKEVLAELVDRADGKDALVHGRKLTKVEKAGSVAYSRVVSDMLPDVDLSAYRGKGTSYWKLS